MIPVDRVGVWVEADNLVTSRTKAIREAILWGYELNDIDRSLLDVVEFGAANQIGIDHVLWLGDGALEVLNSEAPSGHYFDWTGPDGLQLVLWPFDWWKNGKPDEEG